MSTLPAVSASALPQDVPYRQEANGTSFWPCWSPVAEAYSVARTLNACRLAAGLGGDFGRAVSAAYRLMRDVAATGDTRLIRSRAERTAGVLDRWLDVPLRDLARVVRHDLDMAALS